MAETKQLLKIAELSELTGVPKDSIRYYVKEGLLPPPRKTSRNMAYYNFQTYVPRIRLIKELQERRYLPLRIIKEILSAEGGPTTIAELDTLTALDGKLFQGGLPDAPDAPMPRSAVAARVGIPEEELQELERVGILTPADRNGEPYYEPADIRLAETWAEFWAAGFTPAAGFPAENLRVYVDAIEGLARRELGMFAHGVTGRVPDAERAQMAEEGVLAANRLLATLHEKILLRLLHEYRLDMEGGQRTSRSGPAAERGA